MSVSISRRRLALFAGAAATAAVSTSNASAQSPAPPADDFTAARQRIARTSKELSAYTVGMAVEPAFKFQA